MKIAVVVWVISGIALFTLFWLPIVLGFSLVVFALLTFYFAVRMDDMLTGRTASFKGSPLDREQTTRPRTTPTSQRSVWALVRRAGLRPRGCTWFGGGQQRERLVRDAVRSEDSPVPSAH